MAFVDIVAIVFFNWQQILWRWSRSNWLWIREYWSFRRTVSSDSFAQLNFVDRKFVRILRYIREWIQPKLDKTSFTNKKAIRFPIHILRKTTTGYGGSVSIYIIIFEWFFITLFSDGRTFSSVRTSCFVATSRGMSEGLWRNIFFGRKSVLRKLISLYKSRLRFEKQKSV